MELEAVARQLMERSFEASVRADAWSFVDHALVETLIALVLSSPQPQQAELHFQVSLRRQQPE